MEINKILHINLRKCLLASCNPQPLATHIRQKLDLFQISKEILVFRKSRKCVKSVTVEEIAYEPATTNRNIQDHNSKI